ncbi:MAG: hypothetical protein JWO67_2231 [Streptosporangiaceae bacterium]|nr:hypothetical protein [Streptosporangiaceae bacterium]
MTTSAATTRTVTNEFDDEGRLISERTVTVEELAEENPEPTPEQTA